MTVSARTETPLVIEGPHLGRIECALTEDAWHKFGRLAPFVGAAFDFWREVAEKRGLDSGSIISDGKMFTGLPSGHGKHWCFPIPLKCKRPAQQ